MDWHPLMIRLGKSVEELAHETIEEIMGYQGKGGHKPARPDIQKMRDVSLVWNNADPNLRGGDPETIEAARDEWNEKYQLTDREKMMVQMYQHLMRTGHPRPDPQKAFEFVVDTTVNADTIDPDDSPASAYKAARKEVGAALKKYEQQHWPMLYTEIDNALNDAYRRGPLESYKLWPRMVQWIKEEYQNWLQNTENAANRPSNSINFSNRVNHLVDITTEGGAILDRLRRENRIPQNFDANKLNASDFEDWLMQWKRENLGSEHAGQVVYEFKDGWTMQKLTTPEQLQFEGDEMGHCVGGYAHTVGSGADIIYSLRDPKGMPHVTMEIKALSGPRAIWDEDAGEEQPEDAEYNHEYIHPDTDSPNEHYVDRRGESGAYAYRPSGETPFEVVQVMGNSNQTPKPEYQRKVREFLDYLRSKGWKFARSEDWFHAFDDPRQGEYGDGAPDTAQDLDEWYDDHYKTHHEAYRGVNNEDAYGMPAERATVGIGDWKELFEDCFRSLIYEYDPGKWQGNWRDLAQAVYHAWMIDIYKDRLEPEALEKHRKNLVDEIQNAEQTLHEWNDENWYHAEQHVGDEIAEEIKTEAEKRGELQKIEQALDEEYGEDMWNDDELAEWVRDNDEDLYYHATDKARDQATDYFAGDAYKFVNYVIQLAEKHGALNPQDLPDPNNRHGGLPSYEELYEQPWPSQQQQTPVEKGLPGALSAWLPKLANEYQIHPIDHEHNIWFDEDGNQHERWRPGWAKDPATGKMVQTGELEDTFLDRQGRQGEGWVAYHGDNPIGSLTYVADPAGWNMLGTTFVHPDYRQQGLFNRMVAPLREQDKPIDAYVWNNPWLKQKVRGWQRQSAQQMMYHVVPAEDAHKLEQHGIDYRMRDQTRDWRPALEPEEEQHLPYGNYVTPNLDKALEYSNIVGGQIYIIDANGLHLQPDPAATSDNSVHGNPYADPFWVDERTEQPVAFYTPDPIGPERIIGPYDPDRHDHLTG